MKKAQGFTLIETLVAVTIITVAVSGAVFAANSSLAAAMISRDRLTASYLAQEGVEYVRAMRDDAFLHASGATASTDAWTDFVSGSSDWSITGCETTMCTLDPTQSMKTGSGFALNGYANNAPLYFANGGYTQNSSNGVKTPFTRTIQASALSNTEEKIVSTVTWNFHGNQITTQTIDHLTPWQ